MILPIIAYGDAVLRKRSIAIDSEYIKLKELIENMHETMYNAYGVGLAAPQIGLLIRLFIIDTSPFAEDDTLKEEEINAVKDFRCTFINAKMVEEIGEEWIFNEGCLSIPNIREDVSRKPTIKIEYQDEDFNTHIKEFNGLLARVIQHEYDHIEGILFTDKISSLKKRLIKGKLSNISKGKIDVEYKMRFPDAKKKR
ncbi:MAG: peptide deformylase [Bacteroidetes bacterium]|nr:MAG: peptide deformylase [Bacteroidota bacterium]